MKVRISRRAFMQGSTIGAAALAMPSIGAAAAQAFPSRRIELISPFAAGGAHDAHARAIAGVAPDVIDQPMIVVLKPGSSGAIAAQYVANAKPDGHTLLLGGPDCNSAVNQAQNLPYDKDSFVPIAMINYSPTPVWSQPSLPFKDFKGFVEYAKANPGKLKYASSGVWGLPHIPAEYMQKVVGIKLTHVPYSGGGPSVQGFLNGEVDILLTQITQSLPHQRQGKMIPLAIMDTKRHKELPDTPTTVELGFPELQFYQWRGVLAPKGTPPDVVKRLEDIFAEIAANKSFVQIINRFGEDVDFMPGQEFDKYWSDEYKKIGEVIRELKKS